MEKASYFLDNKGIFGSFPTQDSVDELESNGVRIFVDLTEEKENIPKYITQYTYIKYPITDISIPRKNNTFCKFILDLTRMINSLENNKKIYIHCKGGHGRSGVVIASLYSYMFGMDPHEALEMTKKAHDKRPIMRDIWRKKGSPQTYRQKKFVKDLFAPVTLTKRYIYTLLINNLSKLETYMYQNKHIEGDCSYYIYKLLKNITTNQSIRSTLFGKGLGNVYVEGHNNKIGRMIMKIRKEYYEDF